MADRLNFLVVVADQLRAVDLPMFSKDGAALTPNLQRLASIGVAFRQAFGQHSVCSPSRVSFLSGLYPHVRGHRTLDHLLGPDDPNFLRCFKDSGYHVAMAGVRGDSFAPGATERSAHQYGFEAGESRRRFSAFMHRRAASDEPMARAHYHGPRTVEQGRTDFDETVVRAAERWLQRPAASPWLLYVPLVFPHPPFSVEEPWFSMYDRERMAAPRGVRGPQPRYVTELPRMHGWDRLRRADWNEIRAVYLGMVSRLDAHVGRLLDAAQPWMDNTVVVFFSDHGEYLGDYGLVEKWPSGLHECLVRTPLIVSTPRGGKGLTSEALIELVDVFPTLLDLAGLSCDFAHFGRSFRKCLQDSTRPHRGEAFSEGGFTLAESGLVENSPYPYDLKSALQQRDPASVGKAVCLRTPEWTYVWRLYEPAELYHRASDPHETINVGGLPRHAAVEHRLQERLLRWLVETGDVIRPQASGRFAEVELPCLEPANESTQVLAGSSS